MADGHLNFDTQIDEKGFNKGISKISSLGKGAIKTVGTALAGVTAALGAGAVAGVKYNATIEQYQTSFEVMTGSAEKAEQVVQRLTKLGASTPFEMVGLADTTQLLMNYGFTADDAMDKMMMLGDISQGSAEKMNRIAMAYGQMSSAGKVQLEDIKQMIEAGFNPLQEISESTGESMESLYDRISKGTISVDEITASMERSTSAGGKYFQSMEKQSKTVTGQLSTLGDNAQQLLGSLTTGLSQMIGEDILPAVNEMLGNLNDAFASGGLHGFLDELGNSLPVLQGVTNVISNLAGVLQGMSTDQLQNLGKAILGIGAGIPIMGLFGKGVGVVATATEGFNLLTDGVISSVSKMPKSFQNAAKGLSNLGKDFGNIGQTLIMPFQDLSAKFPGITSKISSIWSSTGGKLISSTSKIISGVSSRFGTLGASIAEKFPVITGKLSELSGYMSSWGSLMGDSFSPILQKAAGFAPQFLKYMNIAGGIGIVVAGLGLLYTQFGDQIDNILLMMQTKGPEIITNLCNGIVAALPNLIAQGGAMLNNLLMAITANLPAIIQGGISIVSTLIMGIAQQLPTLIPTAIQMLLTLAMSLLSNIDQLVDAGIQLILGLAQGLINAIPQLINKAPVIIGQLVSAIIRNAPKILQAGIQLISQLAIGLIQAVPQLISKIPAIISQIKNAFTSIDWGSVGKNIISGIAKGLSGAAGAIVDAAKGAAKKALDSAKSFLGIHSPSRVFRDQVGKMMALGVGVGFEKNVPVKSMNAGLKRAVDNVKKDVAFTTSAKSDKSVGRIKRNPIFNSDTGFDYDRFERIQRKVAKEQGKRPIFLGTERIDRPLPKGAIPQV